MGWFDDSDEEDEKHERRNHQFGPFDSPNEPCTKNNENESDEDPLDAYMKTLNNTPNNNVKKNKNDHPDPFSGERDTASIKSQSGGRLDMENEDEATSHWVTRNGDKTNEWNDRGQNKIDSSMISDGTHESNNAERGALSHELSRKIKKASDHQQDNHHGDVDIRLQEVLHDRIGYKRFQKCFLSPNQREANDENHEGDDDANSVEASRNTSEGHAWREENQVTCQPPILDPVYDFAELRDILPEEVFAWNAMKSLKRPTVVQSQTMGVALCGKDAIVTASTGSGKTLSYLWPIVVHLMANNHGANYESNSRSLVLVPTRELALQVEQIARSMFAKLPLKAFAITGGNMGRYQLSQKLQSTKPHCVIATPGRLLDVLSAQQKSKQQWLLPNISLLVLDEADKMIHMGFANQVTQILQSLRPDRQSLMVSATFDSRLQRRCQEWMHDPFRISVGKTGESSKHVVQHVICLPTSRAKIDFLIESLPTFTGVGRTLIFCATRQGVENLATDLRAVHAIETLHGDRHLTDRKAALKSFTKGDVNVLVATDVAGRGLDIPQVSTIINFDPAKNWDTHVHRIGRAGRLSAKEKQQQGSAYTLLLPSNKGFARFMIRAYEREGREVPPEVKKLVGENRRQHSDISRFDRNNSSTLEPSRSQTTKNYYGPASKRSRFA